MNDSFFLSLLPLLAIVAVAAAIIYFRRRNAASSAANHQTSSFPPPDRSTEAIAYQAGRKFRRAIQGATDGAGSAYANSRAKSKIEAKTAKYDALTKLKSLHESGVISDSEFETEKSEILGQPPIKSRR